MKCELHIREALCFTIMSGVMGKLLEQLHLTPTAASITSEYEMCWESIGIQDFVHWAAQPYLTSQPRYPPLISWEASPCNECLQSYTRRGHGKKQLNFPNGEWQFTFAVHHGGIKGSHPSQKKLRLYEEMSGSAESDVWEAQAAGCPLSLCN